MVVSLLEQSCSIVGELFLSLYSLTLILSQYFVLKTILSEFYLLQLRTLVGSEVDITFM